MAAAYHIRWEITSVFFTVFSSRWSPVQAEGVVEATKTSVKMSKVSTLGDFPRLPFHLPLIENESYRINSCGTPKTSK